MGMGAGGLAPPRCYVSDGYIELLNIFYDNEDTVVHDK